jgi:hypothetical protein
LLSSTSRPLVPALNLPPSDSSKWIYVVLFVACGLGAASKAPHSVGLLKPCLLVLFWAIWLKITLEFAWKLPLRFLHVVRLEPSQDAARVRALLVSSIIVLLLSFLIVGDFLA